jgi:ATP-dependent helicase/nuclease subunit A
MQNGTDNRRRKPYIGPNGKREPGIYVRRAADGSEAFEIGWRDAQGTQRWRRVQGGLKAARAELATAHAARARGERVTADPRMTFDQAADAWWSARVLKLRPATQERYRADLRHVRAVFGRRRLTDVSPADVAAFVTSQRRAGLAGWTIKGHVGVLSGVYGYAGRHLGFTGVNPASLLDRVERPSLDDERPKRILSRDELRRLLERVTPTYRLLCELAAETGARKGEVLGLTWADVDMTDGTVTFTAQLDRKGRRVPLKTRRARRSIEVTDELTSKLREARIASPKSGKHDLVFVTRNGSPHNHRNVTRALDRAVELAGLGDVERDGEVVEYGPTFHSFRHTHGSALIAAGWDIEEVSARLGHADVATTMRAYVHEFEASRRSSDRRARLAALYAPADTLLTAMGRKPEA